LAGVQLVVAVEYLHSGLLGLGDVNVVDTASSNHTELLVADPAPEDNFVSNLALLESGRTTGQVEDLNVAF
jgi:hypothetical protein